MTKQHPLVPVGASLAIICVAVTVASTAQAEGQAMLTASGVTCGQSSNFDFTELGPSIAGANATRLGKVRRLHAYAKEARRYCDAQPGPGCSGVRAWQSADLLPWPTKPDVDYLVKRVNRLSGDDAMLVEGTRVLAHVHCQATTPNVTTECVELVAAEESAWPNVKSQIDATLQCMAKRKGAPASFSVADVDRKTRAQAFYGTYAGWTRTPVTDCLAERTAYETALVETAAGHDLRRMLELPTGDLTNASRKAAITTQFAVTDRAIQAVAESVQVSTERKVLLVPDEARRAVDVARLKFEEVRERWSRVAPAPDVAAVAAVRQLVDGYIVAAQDVERKVAVKLPAVEDRFAWSPASVDIGRAAAAIRLREPTPDAHAPALGEEASLIRNATACRNAAFYVSPTREVVRHRLDAPVDNQIEICVDTAGFAVDQPVLVLVSTASSRRVYSIWPGEPEHIAVETTSAETEVAHMTIAGYPRGEVLRAVARHTGGPLNGQDAFDLLAKANAPPSDDNGAALAKLLADLATKIEKDPDISPAINKVTTEQRNAAAPGRTDALLRDDIEDLYAKIFALVQKEPAFKDPFVKKTLDGLLPGTTEVKVPNAAATTKKVTALVKVPEDLARIADSLTGLVAALRAKALDAKTSVQTIATNKQNLETAAKIMCGITSEVLPLVFEDVLVRGCSGNDCAADPNAYIIGYDFAAGFLRSGPRRPLADTDEIFLQVQNVAPGWSIGAVLDNRTLVQRNNTLIGLSQTDTQPTTFSEQTSTSVPGFNALKPLDLDMQAPGTQILKLGRLSGSARYDFRVCASNSAVDDCSTAGKASGAAADANAGIHRTIGLNSLVVHTERYLGVRAGIGVADTVGSVRDLVPIEGSTLSGVRERHSSVDFGLPLLLALYPGGRDAIELPQHCSFGFVAGLDALKFANPRTYLGGVLDLYGIGITGAFSYGSMATVANPENTAVSSAAAQRDNVWLPGVFVGVTTDLDIFQAVYSKYFGTSAPGIAPAKAGN